MFPPEIDDQRRRWARWRAAGGSALFLLGFLAWGATIFAGITREPQAFALLALAVACTGVGYVLAIIDDL